MKLESESEVINKSSPYILYRYHWEILTGKVSEQSDLSEFDLF